MQTRGTKNQEILKFPYKNSGQIIDFPVGTIYGKEDGPTLVVIGGMHGSEFCGIQAAIDLFNTIDPMKLKGNVIICMIYNMPAFINHTGFIVPIDGKNSMRTFPGKLDGTYSEVMAHHFWDSILCKADFCIELHGGDIPEALTPFVFCPITGNEEVDAVTRQLSQAYNIELVINGPANRTEGLGSAFGKLAASGIPAILTEAGQQGILDMENTNIHLTGLNNVLISLGMIEGEPINSVEVIQLKFNGAIRNQTVGMWYPYVKLNEIVKEGQVIGQIRNYFGEALEDIKAPIDGIITVIRTSPSVGLENVLVELHHVM